MTVKMLSHPSLDFDLCFLAYGNNIIEQNHHDGQWESEVQSYRPVRELIQQERLKDIEKKHMERAIMAEVILVQRYTETYQCLSMIKPSAVMSTHTWRIENFSARTEHELLSDHFIVGKVKWGVRSLDELKLVFSRQPHFAFSDYEYFGTYENNAEFEVLANESIRYGSFVNESELGLKKNLTIGYGSGQLKINLVGSCDQDFGDRDGTGSGILLESKRTYKHHVCAICCKKFGSASVLGSHKRVLNKAENKILGVNSSDVEFKLTWVIRSIAR
ncbi:zinc finger C2H2-type/integrase DNA-binding domain-containing protein [Tanacetum coccineum]